jgi:hypothetical protein
MIYNLDKRHFTLISNTAGHAKPGETVFVFEQQEFAVRASYSGGDVLLGSIIGRFTSEDDVHVLFQQVTIDGRLNGGEGKMKLERREDGKLCFIDDWRFLIYGEGQGQAIWQEISR